MAEVQLAGIGMAVVSSLVYSLTFYIKKRSKKIDDFSDFDEVFQPKKVAATLIVGVFVGVSLQLTGSDITQQQIENQLVMYAGTVALVETGIKTAVRYVKNLSR